MKNNVKGITLVALVITIIILLILAGITISQLSGSGLFENAKLAEQKSKEAQEKEEGILSDYENKIKEQLQKQPLVELTVLENIDEFEKVIQDSEKLEYILDNSSIFMNRILSNEQLATVLFSNDNAMNLIIKNDTWRAEILNSNGDKSGENSVIIKALDNSNPVKLPTTGLELYDSTAKTGNVLFSSYLVTSVTHSPVNVFLDTSNDWESETLPAYIGYDYGEGNEVWIYKTNVKGGNDSTPTKMYLQSSNDNIEWNTVYEYTRYTTANNFVTEVIDSNTNNKKARYWRLYITESNKSTYIDILKMEFYAK